MDRNLNNPNDKFVKEMFANREMAIEFLNTYLPGELITLYIRKIIFNLTQIQNHKKNEII